ncbi:MAG: lipoprotein [Candidatus Competibacteraceae bacterium]|jgi:predicted small lipoprotein YifL
MHLFRPGAAFLTGLSLAVLLASCGQKGPLYLPKSKAPLTAPQNPPPKP